MSDSVEKLTSDSDEDNSSSEDHGDVELVATLANTNKEPDNISVNDIRAKIRSQGTKSVEDDDPMNAKDD